MKKILVLGATGSIGTSALDIIKNHSDLFTLAGLSAHKNAEKLCKLAASFNCTEICITGFSSSDGFSAGIKENVKYWGEEGLKNLIKNSDCDIVLNGIAGAAGLLPSITALECKKDLALANKETIVMAGLLVKKLAPKTAAVFCPSILNIPQFSVLLNATAKIRLIQSLLQPAAVLSENFLKKN